MREEAARAAAERVIGRCREIAGYTETSGEISRPFLCESAREVHALLRGWMEQAGMDVRLDSAGNLRGTYAGADPRGPRLLMGSHLDTVPNAGAFDGVFGVVTAVAVVEELHGERLPFAIEVIGFSEEEGVRFARPFLGSMAVAGRFDRDLMLLKDRNGVTVESALESFGLDPSRMAEASADEGAIGYLEVHIEQGPVLESEGRQLGVVGEIVGQTRLLLTFRGQCNHAGTTPMQMRHDPVAAAAEWIVAVEAQARATEGLVATVGRLEARPGAANVIAGEVIATLDLRHAGDAERDDAAEGLRSIAQETARRRGVSVTIETTVEQAAVPMARGISGALERAADQAGYEAKRMSSGAGHDAMVLAERMPAAMLFVRSPGGVSHAPEELVLPEDAAAAIETVMEFLRLLRDGEGIDRVSGYA